MACNVKEQLRGSHGTRCHSVPAIGKRRRDARGQLTLPYFFYSVWELVLLTSGISSPLLLTNTPEACLLKGSVGLTVTIVTVITLPRGRWCHSLCLGHTDLCPPFRQSLMTKCIGAVGLYPPRGEMGLSPQDLSLLILPAPQPPPAIPPRTCLFSRTAPTPASYHCVCWWQLITAVKRRGA